MSALGRRYWLVWSAAIQSNLADGIFLIALPLLAARYTDSPALIAGVALAGRLPWLLFALHAGAVVDRIDRRSTMRVCPIWLVTGCSVRWRSSVA